MGTKTFFVGPQDGWVQIVSGAVTPIAQLYVAGSPHTKSFYIYGGSSAPTAADLGVEVCHKAFHLNVAANADVFYVRVVNNVPDSKNLDGRLRIDVYSQGGVLA